MSSLAGGLGLSPLGVHLLLQQALPLLLGFGLVDLDGSQMSDLEKEDGGGKGAYVFNQCTLVLERVALAQVVEFVIQVLVNLAGGPVLDQKTSKDSLTAHPKYLTVSQRSGQHFPLPLRQWKAVSVVFTHLGILASLVPFLLPNPLCLPILRA